MLPCYFRCSGMFYALEMQGTRFIALQQVVIQETVFPSCGYVLLVISISVSCFHAIFRTKLVCFSIRLRETYYRNSHIRVSVNKHDQGKY